MTESEFLEEYKIRLSKTVDLYIEKFKNGKDLKHNDLYVQSTDFHSIIISRAVDLVNEIMIDNNIDFNSRILQNITTYVPTANYLQLATFSIKSDLLKKYNNETEPILKDAYERDNPEKSDN